MESFFDVKIYPLKKTFWPLITEWSALSNKPLNKFTIVNNKIVPYSDELKPQIDKWSSSEECSSITQNLLKNYQNIPKITFIKFVKESKKWSCIIQIISNNKEQNFTLVNNKLELVEDSLNPQVFNTIEEIKETINLLNIRIDAKEKIEIKNTLNKIPIWIMGILFIIILIKIMV
jgi:hypothetical protein